MKSTVKSYNREFYATQMTGSGQSARKVLPLVCDWIRPTTAIDVGCGVGTWTSELLRLGVDAIGVDGAWVQESMLAMPPERFIRSDLETLTASDLGRKFDLCVSLEVAEHLSPDAGDGFVQLLTSLAPVVLFSAAIPGQAGAQHINERWQSYWADRFKVRGFASFDAVRPRIRGDKDVEWWYRQNIILYVDSAVSASLPGAVSGHLASPASLDLVDPVLYKVANTSTRRMIKNLLGRIFRQS